MAFMVITGASDGIGRALAIEFAKGGYALGLLARRSEKLEETARLCRDVQTQKNLENKPSIVWQSVDVTQSDAQRKILADWWTQFGGIDGFIANAGVAHNNSDVEDSFAIIRQMIDLNVTAVIDALEFLKPKMVARKQGFLVGVSSMAGARGMPKTGGYCLTKAALHTYLEALRMDVRRFGVSVMEIAPGYIETAMTQANEMPMPFLMAPEAAAKKMVKRILRKKAFTVVPWPYRLVYPLLRTLPERIVEFLTRDGA